MQYSAEEVLDILTERLGRDIRVLEGQIKLRQEDKPAAVPVLTELHKKFVAVQEATFKSLAELSQTESTQPLIQ